MGFGSQQDIIDREEAANEANLEVILELAAELLVNAQQTNSGLSELEAIRKAEDHLRLEAEAEQDASGVARVQADSSLPELIGLKPAPGQVKAIMARLRERY